MTSPPGGCYNSDMTYRGRINNGVVVFDDAPPLDEGTVVDVQPVGAGPRRGSAEAILRHAGIWRSEAAEVDHLLDELRRMKQEELRLRGDEA